MKIVGECVAAHDIEDYGHKISQGQQYVVGNFRLKKDCYSKKSLKRLTSLKKALCTIFYIQNGTVFNQQ